MLKGDTVHCCHYQTGHGKVIASRMKSDQLFIHDRILQKVKKNIKPYSGIACMT